MNQRQSWSFIPRHRLSWLWLEYLLPSSTLNWNKNMKMLLCMPMFPISLYRSFWLIFAFLQLSSGSCCICDNEVRAHTNQVVQCPTHNEWAVDRVREKTPFTSFLSGQRSMLPLQWPCCEKEGWLIIALTSCCIDITEPADIVDEHACAIAQSSSMGDGRWTSRTSCWRWAYAAKLAWQQTQAGPHNVQ